MSTDVVSDPLVAAGLLLGMAALLLVLGLAIQAGVNRRRGVSFADRKDPAEEVGADLVEAVRATTIEPPGTEELTARHRSMADLGAWIDNLVEARVEMLVEARLDEVEKGFDNRIDGVEDQFETRIEEVEDALDTGIDEVEAEFAKALKRPEDRQWMQEFETRIEEVEAKLGEVDAMAMTAAERENGAGRAENTVARAERALARPSSAS